MHPYIRRLRRIANRCMPFEKQKRMKKLILIIFISFSGLSLKAQTNIDSLWGVWNDNNQPDTARLEAIYLFTWYGYLFNQPDSAFDFGQMQYDFAKSKGLKKHMASALNIQGISFAIRGDYANGLDHYQKCLKIQEEIGDKMGSANTLNNIGIIYNDQGDNPKALEYYERSLKIKEELGDKNGTAISLGNIGVIYNDQGDYPKALEYYQRSLKTLEEIGDKKGISSLLGNMGVIYRSQGDYPEALEYYQRSLNIFEEIRDKNGIANTLNDIGLIYNDRGDNSKALEYYQRSLKIYEEIGDKKGTAMALNNMGVIYKDQGDNSKALDYDQRSLKIREETGDKNGTAVSLNSIGDIYNDQGDNLKALDYYHRSLKIREELGDKNGIAVSLNAIGSFYQKQGDHQKAINECQKGLKLAQEIGAVSLQKDACECLYDAYKAAGNGNNALQYHEQMLVLADSLQAEETTKQLERMEFQKQLLADSLKQEEEKLRVQMAHDEEVREETRTRNIAIGAGILLLILAVGFYSRWRYMKRSRDTISKERDRSENLLLNILPAEIAEELKAKGKADARDFDMVSILFTDFKGFTAVSAKLSAQDLVSEINTCFEAFDGIMGKYNIEKIKTIGDAYMAAGGLPVPTDDSIKNTVLAALEMQAFIGKRKTDMDTKGLPAFEMRVGIHTGPVVAGIVGIKKFQYDIWGDTVNTASRMESNGEVGKVNISKATYEILKDNPQLSFESRGKIEAKGKGEIEMYFVAKT